jgi:hypothetical protein
MTDLLHSLGYYRDSLSYTVDIDTLAKTGELRTSVNFRVEPRIQFRIDTVWYNLAHDSLIGGEVTPAHKGMHDTLQRVTDSLRPKAVIRKGEPFSTPLISSELDRLVDEFRNNGFLRFSREDMVAVWDTVGRIAITPTLDPFETARQLEELQRRRRNPTASVELRLKSDEDTTHLMKYYVGDVTVYPDLGSDTAALAARRKVTYLRDYRIISYRNAFKPRIVVDNIHLRRGDLYRQQNHLRTANRLNALGAWRLANVEAIPRLGTDTVDFVVRLTPSRKYLFDANLEGSQNWGGLLAANTTLLGIGVNFSLLNRNFARAANQAQTNFRFGTELSTRDQLVQTRQVTFGHTIYFPRVIPRLPWLLKKWREGERTQFAFNIGNTDRKDYFNLTNFNISWGYEFQKANKVLGFRFPNVEYVYLIRRDSLNKLIATNPSYNFIFNNGLISSVVSNLTVIGKPRNPKLSSQTRINFEASGLLTGFIHTPFTDSNLYRFLKTDVEYKQTYALGTLGRRHFAWRVFAGVGYELPSEKNRNDRFLPFFRQYYGGTPNSMRAWRLRRLGPGSLVRSFQQTPDRFGDIQLELNAEYRFRLAEVGGVQINSAFFTDIGNVWTLRDDSTLSNENIRLDRFLSDIGIGAGTGLRIDFGLFLVRADYAFKVKDPSPAPEDIAGQHKWFWGWKLMNGQLQIGVNYPF